MEVYRLPNWVDNSYDLELYHSGKMGMKWGLRRYQNKDGSLTPLGRAHYGVGKARETAKKVGTTAINTADRIADNVSSSVNRAAYAIDERTGTGRETSRFNTSERRASNLGEVGTGVRRRSQIGGKKRLDVSADLSTITPKMTMKAKNFVSDSDLRDSAMDSARAVELGRIGRSYGQRYGGYTIGAQNYNMATRGVATGDKRIARRGISSATSGYTPYSKNKQGMRPGALNSEYKYAMESREENYSDREKEELEEYKRRYRTF